MPYPPARRMQKQEMNWQIEEPPPACHVGLPEGLESRGDTHLKRNRFSKQNFQKGRSASDGGYWGQNGPLKVGIVCLPKVHMTSMLQAETRIGAVETEFLLGRLELLEALKKRQVLGE